MKYSNESQKDIGSKTIKADTLKGKPDLAALGIELSDEDKKSAVWGKTENLEKPDFGMDLGASSDQQLSGLPDADVNKMLKEINKNRKKFENSKRTGIWAMVSRAYILFGYERLFSFKQGSNK